MLYEVTLYQEYYNQECVNRWYYSSAGQPAAVLGSFALASAIGVIPTGTPPDFPAGTMFRALRDIQSQGVTYTSLVVRALYDVTDFYERPFISPVTGNQSGEGASPVLAMGYISSRTRQDIRAATKRFVGVTETNMEAGGTLVPAFITPFMTNLATAMAEALTYDDEGNTLTFNPVVLGKEAYTTPSGNTAYRPYPTLTEQLQHISIGFLWSPYDTVRSQVSRQYGKGS